LSQAQQAMICMVGVQVPLLMARCQGMVFPGVTRVHFAGGRFPQEKLADLARVFPNARVFNNYGCAEAMPRLTVRESTDAVDGANVGKPLRGIELTTAEDHSVMFRSPYGAVGIVEDHVFRAIAPDDWIPTGDLGCIEADGSLRLSGRNSEVFKRHGEKVSIAALASAVAASWHGQVAFYRETDPTGEDGCVLVLAPVASTDQIRPVLMALRKYHPRSHWPIRIETMPELPLLPNGKADLRRIAAASEKREIWKQHI
jgi:acyl-CoA synthetase (AMP-forming)/AMP-acid ligase II